MGMRINTNTDALETLRQLGLSGQMYTQAMQRLSSGKRINSAADDAAGYAISQKLLGQSNGLQQASSNAQDGISMVQTAAGGLQTIQDMLQRLRQLAVQSANDTNTTADRQNLQAEANQISAEIDQIASTTQFNTKNLLDGSLGTAVSSGNLTNLALSGSGLSSSNVTLNGGTLATGSYSITLGTVTLGTASSLAAAGTVVTGGTVSATTAIDDVNNALETSTTPVSVTASNLSALVTGGTAPTASNITAGALAPGTWTITNTTASGAWGAAGSNTIDVAYNGTTYHLKDSTTAGKFDTAASGSIPSGLVIDLSGATTAVHNATATFTVTKNAGVNTANGSQNIVITDETGAQATIALNANDTYQAVINRINAAGIAVTASWTASQGITLTSNGPNGSGAITVAGSDNALMGLGLEAATATAGSSTNTVTKTGTTGTADTVGSSYLSGGPTGTAYSTGSGVLLTQKGWVLSDAASGFSIDLSKSLTSLKSGGVATLNITNNSATLQVGANAGQSMTVNVSDMRAHALGVQGTTAGTALDLTSQTAANKAISLIDTAINTVSTQAADLGATQNRLQNAINNLNIGSENMQAAYSSITNVDMAQESTVLATSQILQQSGVAMLAQANQAPQLVLKLLG